MGLLFVSLPFVVSCSCIETHAIYIERERSMDREDEEKRKGGWFEDEGRGRIG